MEECLHAASICNARAPKCPRLVERLVMAFRLRATVDTAGALAGHVVAGGSEKRVKAEVEKEVGTVYLVMSALLMQLTV